MKNIKIILTAMAIILAAVVVFTAVGLVITAIQYLFWLAVIFIVGMVTVKLLKRSDSAQLGVKGADKELGSASRKLEEYKRKLIAK